MAFLENVSLNYVDALSDHKPTTEDMFKNLYSLKGNLHVRALNSFHLSST
jgi:hypothetical protein